MEQKLKKIYYNLQGPGSLSGVESVFRVAKEKGIKKITREQVKKWLQSQDVYTLHKPARKKFTRNRVIVGGKDDQFQADLVDMMSLSEYNDGFNYILTCIDIFSKSAWAIPLKNKTGTDITEAFKTIFKSGRKPVKLQTDKGTEFLNRQFQSFLKKENVRFFTTNSEAKSSVVERFNRTLKTKMWKYFTFKNTWRYIDVLPDIIKSYNNSFHRSIQMKPNEVNKKNEDVVWHTLYGQTHRKPVRFKFNVGDQVRISKTKRTFDKGYIPNWTREIFIISERLPRQPPVYRLKDQQDEILEGTFYEQELQKSTQQDGVYQIQTVLKRRTRKGKKEVFVKWKGYPDKFNSWIAASDMQSL